ncbi:ATP-binding cassette domain-containing protein [Clostridioides sp. ES-S-0049-02]|uniref:ATP-binding cassette domain-containing protein n=1 Tax=Clostridioides sp. ES-S-0049-02 TaxID=2770778 RepID=UPI001D12EFC4|nr:ATP-binding cassette domain-containing protein [Clostridioides sp. ES-S-0049-02]
MKIDVKNLNMIYRAGKEALKDINISLESPNLIGLLGPNGAGKSTLMKLLTSRILQTSGQILVNGKPLKQNETNLKSKLGYLPQEFGLYDELTVYQFLEYMSVLKGINKNTKKIIEEVISQTNLLEKINSKIKTLSGGQKQRVGIAQAIMGNPELLILDEPTVGLDPEERINFRNLFSKNSRDKIVILSTHIIEDVQSVCNRLIVINKGNVLFDGSSEELIKKAEGHVGVYEDKNGKIHSNKTSKFKVTSSILTTTGTSYRIVSHKLPEFAIPVEPSLEDAYMFLISEEEIK